MKARYERIANVALVVGVASALIFEYAGPFRIVVGGIGAIAGIISIANYLKNQFAMVDMQQAEAREEASRPNLSADIVTASVNSVNNEEADFSFYTLHDAFSNYWQIRTGAPHADLSPRNVFWNPQSYSISIVREETHRDIVGEVVQLVTRLSSDYEVTVTPNGEITVRQIPREPPSRQYDLPYESGSRFIN